MADSSMWKLSAERIIKHCPPSCRRNRNHEACACSEKSKVIFRVIIVARWEGVRRYRAWFRPNPDGIGLPQASNKELFNEQGRGCETRGVQIPEDAYLPMAKMAAAIFAESQRNQPVE